MSRGLFAAVALALLGLAGLLALGDDSSPQAAPAVPSCPGPGPCPLTPAPWPEPKPKPSPRPWGAALPAPVGALVGRPS